MCNGGGDSSPPPAATPAPEKTQVQIDSETKIASDKLEFDKQQAAAQAAAAQIASDRQSALELQKFQYTQQQDALAREEKAAQIAQAKADADRAYQLQQDQIRQTVLDKLAEQAAQRQAAQDALASKSQDNAFALQQKQQDALLAASHDTWLTQQDTLKNTWAQQSQQAQWSREDQLNAAQKAISDAAQARQDAKEQEAKDAAIRSYMTRANILTTNVDNADPWDIQAYKDANAQAMALAGSASSYGDNSVNTAIQNVVSDYAAHLKKYSAQRSQYEDQATQDWAALQGRTDLTSPDAIAAALQQETPLFANLKKWGGDTTNADAMQSFLTGAKSKIAADQAAKIAQQQADQAAAPGQVSTVNSTVAGSVVDPNPPKNTTANTLTDPFSTNTGTQTNKGWSGLNW